MFSQAHRAQRWLESNLAKTNTAVSSNWQTYIPTDLFTILEPQEEDIGDIYGVRKRLDTDLEAPTL